MAGWGVQRTRGSGARPNGAAHSMELPLSAGVYQWNRPKQPGQVVRHWTSSRHGLVMEVDSTTRRMKVCFPDTLRLETRWQTAFYEMDVICSDPREAGAIFDGGTHQGIWWPDNQVGEWYLMRDGTSRYRPAKQAVLRQRSRSTGGRGAPAVGGHQ